MEATQLSCGVYLAAVTDSDAGIVVDYLAAYPQHLGTFIIPWEDTEAADTFLQLCEWCEEQKPVWLVQDGDKIAVCSHSSSIELLLDASHITSRRAAPDEQ